MTSKCSHSSLILRFRSLKWLKTLETTTTKTATAWVCNNDDDDDDKQRQQTTTTTTTTTTTAAAAAAAAAAAPTTTTTTTTTMHVLRAFTFSHFSQSIESCESLVQLVLGTIDQSRQVRIRLLLAGQYVCYRHHSSSEHSTVKTSTKGTIGLGRECAQQL